MSSVNPHSSVDYAILPDDMYREMVAEWTQGDAGPMPHSIGDRVRFGYSGANNPNWPTGHPDYGRTGTVKAWACSTRAMQHRNEQHVAVLKCTYGTSCDYLVDDEGPLIRWDDQDPGDESLDWYPGQGMGVLDVHPADAIPTEGVIQDVMRVDRMTAEERGQEQAGYTVAVSRQRLVESGWHQCGTCHQWWDQLPDEGPCPSCGQPLINE